jgi:hypothetical protein
MLAVYAAGGWNATRTSSAPDETRTVAAAAARTTPSSAAPSPVTAANPPLPAAEKPAVARAPVVTITGCLERDDETFRLKNTTGDDAPKSRSWKTGFLTKRAATIVVDASTETLQRYVGQRVSVTGVLVDRDMQARSVRRVASSCDATSEV